jgi:hypothetical protein
MTLAAPVVAPPVERRAAPRRQPTVNTICRLNSPDGGPQPLALVWNISTTGISVLVPEPRTPGTVLENMRPVRMHVIHCKKLETGDYALGARFEQPFTEDELKPFVAEV